ncbi:hypothetical protein VdG1_08832 [Verticillium dahliae VDG1]|nr:hypothetical protein VdG1_08832 [Verticillium dahliae VDG1]
MMEISTPAVGNPWRHAPALEKALAGPCGRSSSQLLPDTPTTKLIRRDLLQPLGGSAWSEQEKWCPALDYDTDSCYNTVAISPSGQLNAGQDENKPAGEILGWCRKEVHLQQTNIYVRSRCNNGWCVHMYDYYFEADFGWGAHRHDWEHIAVWVQHGQLKFVVYHKDGALTHAFRWANDGDEPPENHWKSWRWGVGAGLIDDWNFAWYINESQYFCWETYCPGFLAPEFKPWG